MKSRSKGAAAVANLKGTSQNENSAGSLQRGKRSGKSGPLASEGKARRGKSQTASAERSHSRKDVRFDKGKVNPS